ncbi:MAG TPA: transposase [Pseudonocardiaceae bacterium]
MPGIDATVALSIVATVGDFTRFRTPEKLVAYLGLNPRVRQSGGHPARHGRITKTGAAHARGMLVEAAWSAPKAAGPLRAFYQRVQARRGMHIAAVATARKLAVLCWHLIVKGEDYAFAQPSLVAHKRRKLKLRAGRPPRAGAKAPHRDTHSQQSAPPSASWPRKPKPPTAPWSPPGNRANPPPQLPGRPGPAPRNRR